MIVFDLKCECDHIFEAWFRSSSAFEEQVFLHEVECPACGSTLIEKAVMAPNVGRKGNQKNPTRINFFPEGRNDQVGLAALPRELQAKVNKVVGKVRKHVEENCEYVGPDFPEEARKIHYGEAPERGIYGEASREESQELIEEGIEVFSLPGIRKPGRTDA